LGLQWLAMMSMMDTSGLLFAAAVLVLEPR